jgi:2-C-methyl-D-erythritol 4-phosphate cytidylyltransferase/2-C-methyl-D-erythritol 2,4-cyclodiphosphate synthase
MAHPARIAALIVAAGTGTRAGEGAPKQYRPIGGKALLRYSVQALLNHPAICTVRVVIHPDHADHYAAAVDGLRLGAPVFGGATRQQSVANGLRALAADKPDYVLVHDAARPFLTGALIDRILEKLSPTTAVVPTLAVADTIRRLEAGQWADVARDGLLRIQTPQAFPYENLCRLHEGAVADHTDDAALWLAARHHLEYVDGDEELRKVTTADDIAWANAKASMHRRIAVGTGFDVHELMPAGEKHRMRIGGIDISHDHKTHGHSDADVALHALVDAMLGALGAGDIGAHFSPTDAQWKGADSAIFVAEALRLVRQRGGIIQHVDITIIAEQPKIGPHRDAIRTRIGELLAVPLSHVSVKATTTEGLGFTGRSEGIAAQAAVTLSLPAEA